VSADIPPEEQKEERGSAFDINKKKEGDVNLEEEKRGKKSLIYVFSNEEKRAT